MNRRRRVVLGLVFVGIVISYIDRGNLSIAAAHMMDDFQFPPKIMGMLLSAFFWTYAGFQIPSGALVDRLGIRRVYAAAFILWSLASASIGLAGGFASILVLRLLLGMAESIGPLASLSFIRQNYSGREQGLPTAIYIAGQNLGPALGALVGTILIDKLGWRFMFIATGLGALLWLPFWLWLAPKDKPKAQRAMETAEAPPQHPVQWKELFATPAFWAMSCCIFLSSYYWYFVLTWVPTYLTSARGFTTLEMGKVLSAPLFAMALVCVAGGYAADRVAKRTGNVFRTRILFASVAFVTSSLILLLLILPDKAAVFPILTISMCATGIGNTSYWAISQHAPPKYMVGRTIGFLNTISQIAGAAAPLITGFILGPQKQFGVAMIVAGVCPIFASALLLFAGSNGLERIKTILAGSPDRALLVD